MNHTNLKTACEVVLAKYPSARDNDVYLYVWVLNDIWHIDLHAVNSIDLLKKIDAGVCPRFDSVSRLRRELQKEKPALQGKLWAERHLEAERIAQQKDAIL